MKTSGKEIFANYTDSTTFARIKDFASVTEMWHSAAAEYGCRVAELNGTFSTVDGTHPDKAGMTMLAELWLRAMDVL